jgi:16S rRNA (guanine1516-N2)-methyltransferase
MKLWSAPECAEQAAQLAHQWGFVYAPPDDDEMFLDLSAQRLQLCAPAAGGPVYVDFTELARRGRGSWRHEAVARAVRGKSGIAPTVIDATAGLGRDAYLLAAAACRVTLLERAPLSAALLSDGLRRAGSDPVIANMRLVHADAIAWLAAQPLACAEVIYLDPMYPERRKSALVKKEMRLFRTALGDDDDALALFDIACARAAKRVVVKRPRHAPPLAGTPHASIDGKSTRFDIYLIPAQGSDSV